MLQSVTALLSPPTDPESEFVDGMAAQGLSSSRIFYSGTHAPHFVNVLIQVNHNGTDNTPANDDWYLSMGYTLYNDTAERIIGVNLFPNGTVDTLRTSQSDLTEANKLLRPLTSFAQSQTNVTIDIWKLLNSLFVGYYWFILGDLGQGSLVSYNVPGEFLVPESFSGSLIYHTPKNNLFLNPALARTVFSDIGLNDTTLVNAITIPNWAANEPAPKLDGHIFAIKGS
jgi:hypothetical protein